MYIVYEVVNGVKWQLKVVATVGGARRSVTALCKRHERLAAAGRRPTVPVECYGWMSGEDWANRTVPMKRVRNLMTDLEFEIAADTPAHCDPSTEAYWSL